MSQTVHEPIRYQNQDFAIHHLIEDCPAHTVVRELLKNAEEAAVKLTPPGRIEWFIETVNGVRKLGLFNEGPGMSAEDLRRLMDMASTDKTLGVDNNYGQGGKVSALKVSPAGVVYRSCKGGRVCEIVLAAEQLAGADHPIYVKRRWRVEDEQRVTWETVLDVTDQYRSREGRPLDKEWTEVVLHGKRLEQDTVAELLPDATRKNWLIRQINQRFYRFPQGVVVHNADASSGQKNTRNAQGLEQLTLTWSSGDDARYEDVVAEHPVYGPVTIRYCKLQGRVQVNNEGDSRAKTMEAYGVGTRGDHIGLVWKDECYEVRTGWSRISGPFGVTFGSANIALQILLGDTAPVKNNTYRDRLLRRDDSGHYVTVEEFADLAYQHRPQWLVDYVEQEARRNNTGSNVMDRLRQYLQELTVSGERRDIVEPGGNQEGEGNRDNSGTGAGGSGGGRNSTSYSTRGRRTGQQNSGIPCVEFTTDPGILDEMRGRAALYRRESNLVLLNPNHFRYQQDLERMFAEVGPDSERRQMAQRIFEDEYMVQAGKFGLTANFADRLDVCSHW